MMILKHHNWLVVSTPLKNMKVSWDDYSIPSMYGKVIQNSMVHHQPDDYMVVS